MAMEELEALAFGIRTRHVGICPMLALEVAAAAERIDRIHAPPTDVRLGGCGEVRAQLVGPAWRERGLDVFDGRKAKTVVLGWRAAGRVGYDLAVAPRA